MAQTSVEVFPGQWYEGQITRPQDLDDRTARNEDALPAKIGYVMLLGTDPDKQGKKPSAAFTFDQFQGIIYSATGVSEKALLTGEIDIITNQGYTYARKGYLAVRVATIGGLTIVKHQDVYFSYDQYGDSPLYSYRNNDDLKTADDASFVVSTLVCTVTKVAHGLVVGQTIVVSDSADLPGLNGTHVVATVPTADTFTFVTDQADDTGHTLDYTSGGSSKIPAIFMQSAVIAAGGEAILEIKLNADMAIGVS